MSIPDKFLDEPSDGPWCEECDRCHPLTSRSAACWEEADYEAYQDMKAELDQEH